MSFSADWLALREPADRAARQRAARTLAPLRALARPGTATVPLQASERPGPATVPLHVLDLGAGTGSNLRALAPRLGGAQRWHAVDHDVRLLAAQPAALGRWARSIGAHASTDATRIDAVGFSVELDRTAADLADPRGVDALFAPARIDLVTASALLDLVGEAWLQAWVDRCRTAGVAVHAALSVDGRWTVVPADRGDARLRRAFERDQRRDKGLGRALGAAAPREAARRLREAGYCVVTARSDWVLDANAYRGLVRELIVGMAAAATAADPAGRALHAAWLRRRLAALKRGRLRMRVGHVDLTATR
jgi:SAM-dependent methyltransferase